MFSGGGAYATIKDLKDLSFLSVGVTIDMQDLKALKRCFHVNARGGQALAMPRSERETVFVGVRFSRRSNARGGQAPALRAKRGFSSPRAVREQVLPNYSRLKVCKTLMSIVYAAHQVLKVR